MAQTVITQVSREYRDLDLNFIVHPVRKDINKVTAEMAVITSIKNLVLTSHYERPFQPDLGCNVRNLLFENLDVITASVLEREITQMVTNYEPRAQVLSIRVLPSVDDNAFSVSMQFNIINRTEPVSIRFNLERLR
jgi:phage baseplate assembly protein W